jgi:D-tyrosyl-tRNA(Tyr) deacylase
MRAVIQRVRTATVAVDGETLGSIGPGLLVLLGIEATDTAEDADWLAAKIVGQRLFAGEDDPWMFSVRESGGEVLLVSQFTLYASTRKGTKPSWHRAAKPDEAAPLFARMHERLEFHLARSVATGRFGAMMAVTLVNDGPVTLIIDTRLRE